MVLQLVVLISGTGSNLRALLEASEDAEFPARVVAIVTRESVAELGLKRGASAAGVVKATSVMVER